MHHNNKQVCNNRQNDDNRNTSSVDCDDLAGIAVSILTVAVHSEVVRGTSRGGCP